MSELRLNRIASLAFVLAAMGCGAPAARAPAPRAPAVSSQTQVDPTDGGRRRASEGARCDFGGAADLTCHRGLDCCYGPPDDPGAFGECRAECPQY
jgi:hypothetical protein